MKFYFLLLSVLCAGAADADLLLQMDTFDSGAMGWASSSASVTTVGSDGPSGAGDAYLRIRQADFHLGARDRTRWIGNYLSAGVTSLEMDVKHLSGDFVNVRLLFWGNGGVWATSALQSISPSWTHHSFSLNPADMTLVSLDVTGANQGTGTGILNDTLSSVNTLLLRHDSVIPTIPGNHPPHLTAAIGVDNVYAVPEPGTLAYMLVSGGGIYLARARRMAKCRRFKASPW